ncbi:hypothetical protein [Desulfoscipio geothermicus]|uniref:Uncharacterized protein n=1 Tax=Desulfoscipio geothermicus DSM 3669 TaxID=1121426 RepID=A0A1I6DWW0_9FIRM|nr:hypothetical protein [Desulfoscipio geothermicus]SFR09974.1 hypothetical protein SAMN05660706_1203 [Desulfoscipio geothermicus DSM 3669]
MQAVWEMLSDKKIWSLLGNVDRTIDEDIVRLMFIELFSRLKSLEEENLALRILLTEEGIVDQDLFNSVRKAVRDFLKIKEEQAAQESDFFASSGVSFPEWVNFKLRGEFNNPFDQ